MRVGRSEDVLSGVCAVLFGQQLAEYAEGDGRLKRRAGLGDDVDVEVHVAELVERVAQRVGGQTVADEEYARVVLAGDGLEQFYRAARAEVGAADADDDQRLGAAADEPRSIKDRGQLAVADAPRQFEPAGEVRACAGAADEGFMCFRGGSVVWAALGKEFFCAGEINFYHGNTASCNCCFCQILYTIFIRLQQKIA